MDLDRIGQRGTVELRRQGVAATFRKVTFSSSKVALAAKNEANINTLKLTLVV